MKKYFLSALTIAICLCSCMNHEDASFNEQDNAAIKENAEKIFGNIDPSQNWSAIKKGTIKITADADLKDIVKVQILTEAPFGNPSAQILNQTDIKKGEKVEMVYDAPNVYDTLFAACVDSEGRYFVKAFGIGDKEVSFTTQANARSNRAPANEGDAFPALTAIVLGEPAKSFNALRAEEAQEKGYTINNDQTNGKGSNRRYTEWNDGSWLNDRLWTPVDATSNGWQIKDGVIQKAVTDTEDLNTIKWLVNYYLPKTGNEVATTDAKSNNWKSIVEGTNYFKEYKNHFISNGQPLTVIPLQMNTTEGKYNSVYYYYFSPSQIQGKSDEEIATFIKSLPKFKVLNGYTGNANFSRSTQYLLPYYGDGAIAAGATPTNIAIPSGYYVGFMNQKANGTSITQCMNGCTYGYGPLNIENNHIFGHYFSAMSTNVSMQSVKERTDGKLETQTKYGATTNGMTWDSPRIGIFSANNKAFMCFEDGCDCNFSDMIIEINSGVDMPVQPIQIESTAYTMCFEDRLESADYDMNDIVLRGVRLNDNQIRISLIACGANDELHIQGLYNSKKLGTQEVHKLFNVEPGSEFINTQKGANYFEPIYEDFNIDKSVNIEDFMKMIKVYNKSTEKTISVPKTGEPPYAIIVPIDFNYPVERCSIISAYPLFKNWAQNMAIDTDWYLTPINGNTYPNKFAQAAE